MTPTSKAVQRVTEISYPILRRKPRPIVIRIEGELLRFREKRGRVWFDLPIDEAMAIAIKCASGFRLHMMLDRGLIKKIRANRGKL